MYSNINNSNLAPNRNITFALSLLLILAITFMSSTSLSAAPQLPEEGTQSVVITPETALTSSAYVAIEDLGQGLNWNYTIQGNGTEVLITVSGDLPANATLAHVTVIDPDAGTQTQHLLGTDGGAILMVVADL